MKRFEVLDEAKRAVGDRPNAYGSPEQNFERIARLWNAHIYNIGTMAEDHVKIDRELSSSDVAIMLGLVKVARLENDPTHKDSWIDLAGYAACGGEVALPATDAPPNRADGIQANNANYEGLT